MKNAYCSLSLLIFFCLQTVVTKICQTQGLRQGEIVKWLYAPPLIDLFSKIELFMGRSVGLKYAKKQKCIGGRGSAPDPAGSSITTLPRPFSRSGRGTPSPFPTPRRLRRLDSRAFGASILVPPPWKPGAYCLSRCFRAGYGRVLSCDNSETV